MSKVNESALKKWNDGETIHATEYNNERTLIVRALNDTDGRVDTLNEGLRAPFSVVSNMLADGVVTPSKIIKESVTQFTYDQLQIRQLIADSIVEGIPQEVIDQIVASASASIGNHVNNEMIHVTAADKNLLNSMVTKDEAILAVAKTYVDTKPWQKSKLTQDNGLTIIISGLDLNNVITTGFYSGSALGHAPGADWYYLEVIQMAATYVLQNIYDVNGEGATYRQRKLLSGTWTAWSDDLFQSGVNAKNGVVAAISAKGVATTNADTWATLAAKIGQISTGGKTLFGNLATTIQPSGAIVPKTISNLTFTPLAIAISIIMTGPAGEQYDGWVFFFDDVATSRVYGDVDGGYIGASIDNVIKGSNYISMNLKQVGTVQGTIAFNNYYILGG